MYDAVFRPDSPPSPPGSLPPHGNGEEEEAGKQPGGDGGDGASDEAANSGSGGDGGGVGGGGVKPFLPDERLTLEEAVWMYTAGAASAAGAEARLGAIRPGLLADLSVVEVEGGGEALLENPRLVSAGTQ